MAATRSLDLNQKAARNTLETKPPRPSFPMSRTIRPGRRQVNQTMVVVAGAAESLVDTKDFPTIGDGMGRSIVTITTVGYGDLYPSRRKDGSSRRWSCFVGIGFLSVLTATCSAGILKSSEPVERSRPANPTIMGEFRAGRGSHRAEKVPCGLPAHASRSGIRLGG
jgi:hypothetical protein